MITLTEVKQKLETALPGAVVEVYDFSEGHQTHQHEGDHIGVNVTYARFEGKSLLEQHQMIYDALQEELKEQIHALKIKTKVN